MKQIIKDTYKNNDGQPVVIVTGGKTQELTKENLKKCQEIFAEKADFQTSEHAETGLRCSGEYQTTILVRGDDFDTTQVLFDQQI